MPTRRRPNMCACCGRPLSDPMSIARSVGPECAANERCRRQQAAAIAPRRYVVRWVSGPLYAVVDADTGDEVERGIESYVRRVARERNVDAYLAGIGRIERNQFTHAD